MNTSIKKVTLVALVLTLCSAAASAQDNGQCAGQGNAAQTSASQTFCFVGENVPGSLVGASGQTVRPLRQLRGPSLLRLRAHFVPEMMKGVENL